MGPSLAADMRHAEKIWVPALIFLVLVGFHLLAARVGQARRAARARKRAARTRRREGTWHEHLLSTNESIEPK